MPSPSPSKLCGSGESTLKRLYEMSSQSRSGGGGGIHTSGPGYAGEQSGRVVGGLVAGGLVGTRVGVLGPELHAARMPVSNRARQMRNTVHPLYPPTLSRYSNYLPVMPPPIDPAIGESAKMPNPTGVRVCRMTAPRIKASAIPRRPVTKP